MITFYITMWTLDIFALQLICVRSVLPSKAQCFVHISLPLRSHRSAPVSTGRKINCCCCYVLALRGKTPGCLAANRPTTNLSPFFSPLSPPSKRININNQLRRMERNALILSRIMLETVVTF